MDERLAQFCRQEHVRLVAALDLVLGDRALAEDFAQEALARVCRDWRRVSTMDAPGAYAHRIGINLAKSHLRRRAAERRARDRAARSLRESYDDPDTPDRVAIRGALQSLPLRQRQVLVARFYLGYDVAGTAHLLRLPVNTVKSHTARGLAGLRASLDPSAGRGQEVLRHA